MPCKECRTRGLAKIGRCADLRHRIEFQRFHLRRGKVQVSCENSHNTRLRIFQNGLFMARLALITLLQRNDRRAVRLSFSEYAERTVVVESPRRFQAKPQDGSEHYPLRGFMRSTAGSRPAPARMPPAPERRGLCSSYLRCPIATNAPGGESRACIFRGENRKHHVKAGSNPQCRTSWRLVGTSLFGWNKSLIRRPNIDHRSLCVARHPSDEKVHPSPGANFLSAYPHCESRCPLRSRQVRIVHVRLRQ